MSPTRSIYFDNNATTRVDPAVLDAMKPFLGDCFANPAAAYEPARVAALAIAEARSHVARLIGAQETEITFTSGGTESNAAALASALRVQSARRHIVASAVEHASLHAPLRHLAASGYRVTWVPVSAIGQLDLDQLDMAVTSDTALVTVMTANNETGTLLSWKDAARIARARGALFHTDAVQAAGKIAFDVKAAPVDTASLCAHKMHGPKGVGVLYVRTGVTFDPSLRGGDQEYGRRAGTENVPGIVGFGCAARLALQRQTDDGAAIRVLREAFESQLLASLSGVRVVAQGAPRLPNTSLLLIDGVETEALLALLDMAGACCSSGSACAAGSHEPSHVLLAMGLVDPRGAVLRVSLSRLTTRRDVEGLVQRVRDSVRRLRGAGSA